jgi:HSP20 family molecular chaperone IbpA
MVETTSPFERIRKKQRLIALQLLGQQNERPSRQYELIDNEDKFQLTMDVPGIQENDIDIKLDDGTLTVQGHRVVPTESSQFTSIFFQSFSLDRTVDVDTFTASLKNGVLVVSASKDLAKLEENVRRIPITTLTAATDGTEFKPIDIQEDEPNDTNIDTPQESKGGEESPTAAATENKEESKEEEDSPTATSESKNE